MSIILAIISHFVQQLPANLRLPNFFVNGNYTLILRVVVSNSPDRPVTTQTVNAYFCRHEHLNLFESVLVMLINLKVFVYEAITFCLFCKNVRCDFCCTENPFVLEPLEHQELAVVGNICYYKWVLMDNV